jgi:uncharacterized protein (DUF433 family)
MPVIREALNAIREAYPADRAHPLNSGDFLRHGKVLFLKKLEETVNLSRPRQGQLVLGGDLLDPVLERIVRDDDGPFRLFPMKNNPGARVMADLFIASGQPVVSNTGILAEFIHERHKYGETVEEIAEDYGIDERAVADAIRYIEAA